MSAKKWTKEAVLNEAKKYKTKKDWSMASTSSYQIANKKGWMDDASAHMKLLWQKKWSKEAVLKEANKYKTKADWRKFNLGSYSAALKKGWMNEASGHMESLWEHKWTKEAVLKEARKHKTRSEWKTVSASSYKAARKNGWLEEATQNMELIGNMYKRCIYLITVQGTNYAYIGLTYDLKKRFNEHLKTKRFIELKNEFGLDSIKIKQLTDYIEKDDASKLENKLIEEYREKGYHILNVSKGGALGGGPVYWTEEKVLAEALKYTYRYEWKLNSPSSHQIARNNKWLDKMSSHMVVKRRKAWTKKELLSEAKKYKTKSEWYKESRSSYSTAILKGWREEAAKHMISLKRDDWTKKQVIQEAKKYKTKSEWNRNSSGSYSAASKNGWRNEASKHMLNGRSISQTKWTKENVLLASKKYKTVSTWIKYSLPSYNAASKKGWLKEASKHMKRKTHPGWTKEKVIKEAKKYKSKAEWNKSSTSSCQAAYRRGWMDEASAHMARN